jgi:hypothetical protein
MFDAGIAHAKKQSQLAKVNKELLEACLEATCLFNDYPQCYESIGTHQVLHIAINNATKAASAPIGESS